MSGHTLERLLETCVHRRATDMLLLPHSPPQIRLSDCWRTLQTAAITPADIASLCEQIFTPPPSFQSDGYAYYDFWYGNVAQFRAMAFGYPNTTALILMHHLNPVTPPPEPPTPRRF